MWCRIQQLRWFLIFMCLGVSKTQRVILKCDEFDSEAGAEIHDLYFCTITGLRVTHSQHVVVDRNMWPSSISTTSFSYMKFYDSSLLYIPQAIFSEFRYLKNLDISNSSIIELSRNTFTSADNLTWLQLNQNNITEIAGSVFLGATNLRQIDLSSNRIARLSVYSFSGLKGLNKLNLSKNKLVNIEKDLFNDNLLLEILYLDNNQIDHLDAGVFSHLELLNFVNLSENKLTKIDENIFTNCPDIRAIYLSGNYLRRLYLNVSDSLRVFNADRNELEDFLITCSQSNPGKLQNASCQSLESLALSQNKLTNLNNIAGLSNLKQLALSHNNVGKLNVSTLAKLKNLERLQLKHTNLSGLTFGTFSQQTNLKSLDISDNMLGHLNMDIFLPYLQQNLEEFDLSGNNLTEIQGRYTFAHFVSLKKLGLWKNQFNCSYLLRLISFGGLGSKVHLDFNETSSVTDREHIRGIECTNSENLFQDGERHRNIETSSPFALWNDRNSIQLANVHEKQLEQHLFLMRIFVILIAILLLSLVIYKVTQLFTRNRDSWVNIISYRSTNTIQSEMDVP